MVGSSDERGFEVEGSGVSALVCEDSCDEESEELDWVEEVKELLSELASLFVLSEFGEGSSLGIEEVCSCCEKALLVSSRSGIVT